MTIPFIDAAIVILLVISVGFGGIGMIGLLVFPDIRSRMYTATRAPVISIGAMVLAVILYAFARFLDGGEEQYITLILHILILLSIVIVANVLMHRTILERNKPESACQVSPSHDDERE